MNILITCPPMLVGIEEFRPEFTRRGADLICPNVVQTLSVEELVATVPGVDGWIAGDDPINREVLTSGRRGQLRAIVKWGVGVDNVDFGAAADIGISVVNTPGMFGAEVADVAVSYVTALARETFIVDRAIRSGSWTKPAGISLSGKVICVIGFGDIGRNVAKRLLAADMKVIAYDPQFRLHEGLEGVESASWPNRLVEADFLVFTCALTSQNRHMLDRSVLARLKPGIRIVNVARGALIDERALIIGLESGQIHSAALDVFETEPLPQESPLRHFERCVFGSHNASNTVDAVRRTSYRAVDLLFEGLCSSPVPT